MATEADSSPQAFKFLVVTKIFEFLGRVIQGIVWLGVAYFGYRAIAELAGKTTIADFFLAYITGESHPNYFRILPWIVTMISVGWASAERYLRKRVIVRMGGQIEQLEKRLDPNRTSSMLTKHGENNPQDAGI